MDRVNWVTQDCFNAVAQLSRLGQHDRVQPDLVHARLRGYVDQLFRRAREAGYADQEAQNLAYPIVALADEVAMAHAGSLRDHWATQPLQLVYYGENVAGENFFVMLEQVRQSAQKLDVLRVFYTCLLLGFQGRYRMRGAEGVLLELTESVKTQLLRALPMPEVLSPNGPRPEEGLVDASSRFPVVWIGSALLALSVVLYLGLVVSLRDQLSQFVAWMGTVTGT